MRAPLPLFLCLLFAASTGQAGDCSQGPPGSRAEFPIHCQLLSPIAAKDQEVRFPSGSSELMPEAMATLDRQAWALLAYPKLWVDIIGHVDRREAATPEGLRTGYMRALAVRDYLIRRGVAADRISTDSHGDREILPRDDSESAMAGMRFARTHARD